MTSLEIRFSLSSGCLLVSPFPSWFFWDGCIKCVFFVVCGQLKSLLKLAYWWWWWWFSSVQLFATPWTIYIAQQAPLSMGFPSNTGGGCPFLPQGIFLIQGSNPGLLHYRQILYPTEPPGKSCLPQLLSTTSDCIDVKQVLWFFFFFSKHPWGKGCKHEGHSKSDHIQTTLRGGTSKSLPAGCTMAIL